MRWPGDPHPLLAFFALPEGGAPLAVKLLRQGQLKTYSTFPHGCMTTHPDEINADILGFLRGEQIGVAAAESPAIVAEPLPVG